MPRAISVYVVLLMLLSSMGMVTMGAFADMIAPSKANPAWDHSTTITNVDKFADFNNGDVVTFATCPNWFNSGSYYTISSNVVWDGGSCTFNSRLSLTRGPVLL